jgi:hypothetical protein
VPFVVNPNPRNLRNLWLLIWKKWADRDFFVALGASGNRICPQYRFKEGMY